MRVLLIADADFAFREHGMLRRIQVGLLDEGIVAQQAHSVATPAINAALTGPDVLRFQDAGPSVTLAIRARRLIRTIEERADAPGSDERLVDVVHGFGHRAWPMARAVAQLTHAALCCEVHAATLLPRIARTERAATRALGTENQMTWSCPDPMLVEEIEDVSNRAKVRCVPWGVHVPSEPPIVRQPDCAIAIAVLADADSKDHPNALLEALAGFDPDAHGAPADVRERAEAMTDDSGDDSPGETEPWMQLPDRPIIFVDENARLWLHRAGKLDEVHLRKRLTLSPSLEANRLLTLRCDALVLPTPTGAHSSLTLDAMAAGVRVIAANDPGVAMLRENQTAFLTDTQTPDTDAWAEVLDRAFADPGGPNPLAESAREVLRAERLASHQIAELINLYTELAGPPPAIAFKTVAKAKVDVNT